MSLKKKAFVLMPFKNPYNSYYDEIYSPALREAGCRVSRADDMFTPHPVMNDVRQGIIDADLILCEMTERNPNVFYELGLAHAIGKPAILISREEEDIPFDLRHIRYFTYDRTLTNWAERLKENIIRAAGDATASSVIWPPPLLSFSAGRKSSVVEAQSNKLSLSGKASSKSVQIGRQEWMTENLSVDHYRNGDPIPEVQDPKKWGALNTGAWCFYENDSYHGKVYGRLYNWYAVNDPRGLAPEGWHVPSDKEWQELERFLGMSWDDAEKEGWRASIGGKLKETGTLHWRDTNAGATNETGFTALAGGDRNTNGGFYNIGNYASFWSSSASDDAVGWFRVLIYIGTEVGRNGVDKRVGMPVRCVWDD